MKIEGGLFWFVISVDTRFKICSLCSGIGLERNLIIEVTGSAYEEHVIYWVGEKKL